MPPKIAAKDNGINSFVGLICNNWPKYIANGIKIDTGAFISGLEYATQTSAHIIGKPSKSFFDLAIKNLKIGDDKIAMVGDDLYNDIEGANNLGFFSILVKTGKYKEGIVKKSKIKPNLIINSIAELPDAMRMYI